LSGENTINPPEFPTNCIPEDDNHSISFKRMQYYIILYYILQLILEYFLQFSEKDRETETKGKNAEFTKIPKNDRVSVRVSIFLGV